MIFLGLVLCEFVYDYDFSLQHLCLSKQPALPLQVEPHLQPETGMRWSQIFFGEAEVDEYIITEKFEFEQVLLINHYIYIIQQIMLN